MNRTIYSTNLSHRFKEAIEQMSGFGDIESISQSKIKTNKAFKLNNNNFGSLHTNVRPFHGNHLFSKLRK